MRDADAQGEGVTPAQRAFFDRLHRRVAGLTPDMVRAYLAGIDALRDRLTDAQLNAMVKAGAYERYISLALSDANFAAAFSKYRAQVQMTADAGGKFTRNTVPRLAAAAGDGYRVATAFDRLSPQVIEALRALDTKVMARLATDTRETVRAIIENGLRDGTSARQTSIAIREMIGLGPTQVQEVANYRAALEGGKAGKALGYAARDRRFDASVKKGALDAAKIDKMVEAYTKRRVAINAATTARTATLESFKAGQRLSWEDAISKGIVDGGQLVREWITVLDGRERPEHNVMNGARAGFDEPFSNGDMTVGEGSPWNCRCVERVIVVRDDAQKQDMLTAANDRGPVALSDVLQYAARLAPTEAIGASAELAETGWATATDAAELSRRAAVAREAVADVTKKLGYRGEIEVVEQATGALRSRLGDQFSVMGQYYPGSKRIQLFAENIPSAAEARGVLVHEITHAQFDARIVGKRDNFEWMRRNVPALAREDGVSPYSTSFWRRAASGDFMAQRDAINETLAEWSRLRAAGQAPSGRPTYQALYDRLFPKKGKK